MESKNFGYFIVEEKSYKNLFEVVKNQLAISTVVALAIFAISVSNGSWIAVVLFILEMLFVLVLQGSNLMYAAENLIVPLAYGCDASSSRTLLKQLGWKKAVFSGKMLVYLITFLVFFFLMFHLTISAMFKFIG